MTPPEQLKAELAETYDLYGYLPDKPVLKVLPKKLKSKLLKTEKRLLKAGVSAAVLAEHFGARLWFVKEKKDRIVLRVDAASAKATLDKFGVAALLKDALRKDSGKKSAKDVKVKFCSVKKQCCMKACEGCFAGDKRKRKLWG